ncbi:MAG: tetraacyldisaccharide 4'-kinase [Chitinophagales bacterium]
MQHKRHSRNLLLLPLSIFYAIGIVLRDLAFRWGINTIMDYEMPIIGVGNLTVGGSGKTPHTYYLLNHLAQRGLPTAYLSRGYGRKSTGYREVSVQSNAENCGDEALLAKHRFPQSRVVVSESRSQAIPDVYHGRPVHQVTLLDDAFQHRSIKPGLQILLTRHDLLFCDDYLLPYGRLREFRSGYHRADIIVVTKCPQNLTIDEQSIIRDRLRPLYYQYVCFTTMDYKTPYAVTLGNVEEIKESQKPLLAIAGLADNSDFFEYMRSMNDTVSCRGFQDHHAFTAYDIESILSTIRHLETESNLIITEIHTTEKDLMRLKPHLHLLEKKGIRLIIHPIEVRDVTQGNPLLLNLVDHYADHAVQQAIDAFPSAQTQES